MKKVHLVGYYMNYTEMHGQQNIKNLSDYHLPSKTKDCCSGKKMSVIFPWQCLV